MIDNIPCQVCAFDPTLKITGSWVLTISAKSPSANTLKGNGKGRSGWKYRLVRDNFLALVAAQSKNVPVATEKRRVFFSREYAGKCRRFDRDNLVAGMKPLRDCLTELKLIVDDADKWLEAHYEQRQGDVNQIIITIEDILWLPTQTMRTTSTESFSL